MSDDTRQARIAPDDFDELVDEFRSAVQCSLENIGDEAASENEAELRYYLKDAYRTAFTAAADAAAAPAVGVTVKQAEAMLDRYFTNRFESIMADGQHLAIGFLEQAEAEKADIIALLTAQPEPGAEGETE